MNEALSVLDNKYDYIILDTPPGWGAMTINVLFYTKEVLAPVSLEAMTLQGLLEFEQSLAAIKEYFSMNIAALMGMKITVGGILHMPLPQS